MLKRMFCVLMALCFAVPWTALSEEYQNPMTIPGQYPPIRGATDDYGIGDPFVMRWNGMYYLYASSCEDRVRVFTSRNLVHWEFRGWCTENRDVYFAYAPEVVYWRGDFYMITSPGGGGHYILKSDSPLGVFRPVTGNFGYQIDGSFFVCDDGSLIMLFPEDSQIRECRLNENTLLPDGVKFSTSATLRHWTEGPGLFRRGEWYYLTFTGNHLLSTGYRVAYAVRYGSPTGRFDQPNDSTLIIRSVFGDGFTGLGHSSNFIGPDLDSLYTAYHSYVSAGGPARLYNLDRLFTNGGYLYTSGPTDFSMPVPAMPDVFGDAAEDPGDFSETETGYFAEIPASRVFTQECGFILEEGGTAVWLAGSAEGEKVFVTTDGSRLRLFVGEKEWAAADVPFLGEKGKLHTLRLECDEERFFAYIDGMRLIALSETGFSAGTVGAVKGENVSYSFMACTARALGSGDNEALKVIPGRFSAIHALNRAELSRTEDGKQEETVPVLGKADYAVRVASDGTYVFDFTVCAEDRGREIALFLDGESLWRGTVPAYSGKEGYFTFSSSPVSLPAGDHVLSLSGEDVRLSRVASFLFAQTPEMYNDFSGKDMRSRFITLGAFNMNASEGLLSIKKNRTGFALFGEEGQTDYELRVRFRIPREGSGTSGILLRAANVSLYDAQVAESYYGYGVILSRLGFSVQKTAYGAVGSAQFTGVDAWKDAQEAEVILRVRGNRIEIFLPGGEVLYTLEDAQPFTHGMYGFFSTGKELQVVSCDAVPLE